MKKIISILMAVSLLMSLMIIPASADVLTEEKIPLSDKNMYMFSVQDGEFKLNKDVTGTAEYILIGDSDYSTDMSAFAGQNILVIDLGQEYPISTIKAYQNEENTSNFICFYPEFEGINDSFVRSDLSQMIRTNISSTTENGATCYTKSELDSNTHNMGSFRYVFVYNWSTTMTLSELELYKDTTVKEPNITVNNFYQSGMVLQRNKNHVIKGFSATGTEVTVTMTDGTDTVNTQTVKVTPDSEGYWVASLNPMTAGLNPYTLTISDDSTAEPVVLEDVLVGDVFLASGQSNMAYDAPKTATQSTTQDNNVSGPADSGYYKKGMYELQKVIAENGEKIRMFKMRDDADAESGVVTKDVPIWIDWHDSDDIITETNSAGTETTVTHESILALSSLAAFFADEVQEGDIPVGIIQASRGGSAINIWSENGTLYNNHIAPLNGFNIAGILWYQGCANSNATGFKTYYDDFKSLIKNYRSVFNDEELPFLYVQLAPFKNSNPEYVQAGSQRFQVMREIQRELLNDDEVNTNLYMAVSMDTTQDSHHDSEGNVVHQSLIHPLGKDTLGIRMAKAYKSMANNDNSVISGPLVSAAKADGDVITVTFKENTAEGLKVLNPDYTFQHDGVTGWQSETTALEEFKIAGEDGVYYDATATIDGDTVKVTSENVTEPKYVSYAYSEIPANPNLANGADLPASPFNIGVDDLSAPTAAPETEPTEEPTETPTEEPTETPTDTSFTYESDDTLERGVEKTIADVNIFQNSDMQFEDGDNVAIIGDSITNMDFYSSLLTELYAAKKPNDKIKFYNMGIGGNTALLGLQMLDKEFEVVKEYDNVVPNKAIIMFGMNDSSLISGQNDEENIEVYKSNMTTLVEAVKAKGVEEITIMSSSPYDDTMESEAVIATNKIGARSRLIAYAQWLEKFSKENDCYFINLTEIMYDLLDEYQKEDKTRTFINSADRVHPKELGGFVMMYIIAKSHGLDGINSITEMEFSDGEAELKSGEAENISTNDGISFTYTPSKGSIYTSEGYFEANRIVPLTKDFNQEIIKITGLEDGYYDINMNSFKAGPYTAQELEEGINIAVIPNSPVSIRTAQIYGDMFAAHRVTVNYIRNIRTAEKKAMQAGVDITDDAAVSSYVENANETELLSQYKNAYINYKPTEKALFEEYTSLIDKLYDDANTAEKFDIVISRHHSDNNMSVFKETFNNGISKWKVLAIGSDNASDYGSTQCDYVTGSNLSYGSGAGSVKINIGINKARNYCTVIDYINIIGGMEYVVSSSIKTENVRADDLTNMSVIFLDSDKTALETHTIADTVKGTHDWTVISGSIKAPESAVYMRIDISGRGMTEAATEKQGIVWFDDVKVEMPLQNGDFEEASDGVVSDWSTDDIPNPIPENYSENMMNFSETTNWKVGSGGSTVKASYDKTVYVTGSRALKFISTASGTSTDRYYVYPSSDAYIRLKPNTSYKITMKAKVEDYQLLHEFSQTYLAGVTYQALLYGESDGAADTSSQYTLTSSAFNVPGNTGSTTTADWADYSMILTTPDIKDGQTYQYLRSNIMMRFASGTAWVDSVTIKECDANGNEYTTENADVNNKISGTQSLCIQGSVEGTEYISEAFAVIGTQKYLFNAYAKKDDTAQSSFTVEMYDSNGTKLDEELIEITSSDFAEYSCLITVPKKAVYAVIRIYAKDGIAYADSVGMCMITSKRDVAYSNNIIQMPTPTITVNAECVAVETKENCGKPAAAYMAVFEGFSGYVNTLTWRINKSDNSDKKTICEILGDTYISGADIVVGAVMTVSDIELIGDVTATLN